MMNALLDESGDIKGPRGVSLPPSPNRYQFEMHAISELAL